MQDALTLRQHWWPPRRPSEAVESLGLHCLKTLRPPTLSDTSGPGLARLAALRPAARQPRVPQSEAASAVGAAMLRRRTDLFAKALDVRICPNPQCSALANLNPSLSTRTCCSRQRKQSQAWPLQSHASSRDVWANSSSEGASCW